MCLVILHVGPPTSKGVIWFICITRLWWWSCKTWEARCCECAQRLCAWFHVIESVFISFVGALKQWEVIQRWVWRLQLLLIHAAVYDYKICSWQNAVVGVPSLDFPVANPMVDLCFPINSSPLSEPITTLRASHTSSRARRANFENLQVWGRSIILGWLTMRRLLLALVIDCALLPCLWSSGRLDHNVVTMYHNNYQFFI